MMIHPFVQFPGMAPTGATPGLPTADGAPKGLFAALFGEQQAALLAETTGAPVLLWPDGTLSAAVEGEAIPLGALLVLPDGTQVTAYGLPAPTDGDAMTEESALAAAMSGGAVQTGGAAQPAEAAATKPGTASPGQQPAAQALATASRAQQANAPDTQAADGKPAMAASLAEGGKGRATALWGIESPGQAEPYSGSRQGGAGAFAAAVFAAQSARLEAGLARDALHSLTARVQDGDPAAQSFARTDAVRPTGESAPLTGQGAPNGATPGLDARHEAAAMRSGMMSERPTLGTLGEFTVRAVRVLSADGEQSMTVRLVPETLGELKLVVRTVGESVHLHVVAASAAVRDALDGQMQSLRDALSREGIDLARVTVGSETAGQQASARQPGDESANARTLASGPMTIDDRPTPDGEAALSYRHAPRAPDALLDLFA
jgi:flagellar hook-length control protein FliK